MPCPPSKNLLLLILSKPCRVPPPRPAGSSLILQISPTTLWDYSPSLHGRQDELDDAIFCLIQELSPVMTAWDMEVIGEEREVIGAYLKEKYRVSEMQFYWRKGTTVVVKT
jgi:hypothetical protein